MERRLDDCIPEELDLHLIVDNYATHKHPKVRTWLAHRPRYHIHYTPTYSSWLNQVERWFGLITQRAIRRGSFSSVKDLVEKIDAFVQHYNRCHHPFVWTATADSTSRLLKNSCRWNKTKIPRGSAPANQNRVCWGPLKPLGMTIM